MSHSLSKYYTQIKQRFTDLKSNTTHVNIDLYATSLTYYSLLCFVPILTLILSILQSLSVDNALHSMIKEFLLPMANSGKEIGGYLFDFIGKTQSSFLHNSGVALFCLTALLLLKQVEQAINSIWQAQRTRSIWMQLIQYSLILIFATIIFALASFLKDFKHSLFVHTLAGGSKLALYALITVVEITRFCIYVIIVGWIYQWTPATRVHKKAALVGAATCIIVLIPVSHLFTQLIALNNTYSALFNQLAALIIVLLWLNYLWKVFLFGSLVSYLIQQRLDKKPTS